MPQLILLIGLPASGKSTLAKKLVYLFPHSPIIATDRIRAQLFGDESNQGSWLLIWREILSQFTAAVAQIHQSKITHAIYDATNAERKQRKEAIALARSTGFTNIIGIWIQTPLAICLERNNQRIRQVPEEIILQMSRCLEDAPPALEDGFDRLILVGCEARNSTSKIKEKNINSAAINFAFIMLNN